jgi:hypothetical protein
MLDRLGIGVQGLTGPRSDGPVLPPSAAPQVIQAIFLVERPSR